MQRLSAILSILILLALGASQPSPAKVTVGTLSFEREAVPGERYEGSIIVSNDGDQLARVSIYQTDYAFASDGTNRYADPGHDPRSNAPWVSLGPTQLDVPPRQTSRLNYVVNVPANSALVGTYWSMIMVEEQAQPEELLASRDPQPPVVHQVLRYGVQCVTHIRDTGQAQVKFTASQLVALDSVRHELQVDVENTGDRWIVPTPYVELFDLHGSPAGRFECAEKRIFPGMSVRFRLDLGATPGGRYKALVVLDNGEQQLYGARYDLDF
ncbi:hypothetical protein HZB60_03335 [candidate division KSB1 bacterium]|nr:hypothetical protein [candidate division KSB1 bacterium]